MSITIEFHPPTLPPLTYHIATGTIRCKNVHHYWWNKSDLIRFITLLTGLPAERIFFHSKEKPVGEIAYILQVDNVIKVKSVELSATIHEKLPHATPQMRQILHSEIQAMPTERVDLSSLCEISHPATEVAQKIHIIHAHDNLASDITKGGEKMIPYALLPNDGGVELRSEYQYQYRVADDAQVANVTAARQVREEDIAHCQKLLHDLPVALENNGKEKKEMMNSNNPDIHRLGCITIEQGRIEQEIEAQKQRLAQLESSPVPQFDISLFITRSRQSCITMKFGYTLVDGQLYSVSRINQFIDQPIIS